MSCKSEALSRVFSNELFSLYANSNILRSVNQRLFFHEFHFDSQVCAIVCYSNVGLIGKHYTVASFANRLGCIAISFESPFTIFEHFIINYNFLSAVLNKRSQWYILEIVDLSLIMRIRCAMHRHVHFIRLQNVHSMITFHSKLSREQTRNSYHQRDKNERRRRIKCCCSCAQYILFHKVKGSCNKLPIKQSKLMGFDYSIDELFQ